jgi:antitoxin HicB
MMSEADYPFSIRPLTQPGGGGYLIEYPDLPGCMSDGETIEEAIANGRDAQATWIAAMHEAGRKAPSPRSRLLRKVGAAHAEVVAPITG